MKGNVIRLNIMHLNSVHLNSIGEVQSVSLTAGESTEDPVYPPTTYTLAANVSNGKVTATKNGTAISLPYVATEGDVIVLSVTPDEGYEFNGWLDGNKSNPRTVTMTGNVVLSASCVEIAKPTYTLSASVTNGKVSAKRNGSAVTLPYTANEGDTIVLSVTPNDGYAFEGWADGNTDNPRSITMNADKVLSAECSEVVQPPVGNYIQFEDAEIERVLMSKGVSSDGVGITIEDAAKVTSISTWFKGNTAITSFEEFKYFKSCTTLVASAFEGCTSLTKLNIEHIEVMNNRALYGCTALNYDYLNLANLVTLGGNALYGVKVKRLNLSKLSVLPTASTSQRNYGVPNVLEEVVLADNAKTIPAYSFWNYSVLHTCNIPKGITTIGDYALASTSLSVDDLNLPNLETIGIGAFRQTRIKKVSNLGKIVSIPNGADSNQGSFANCTDLTSVNIPTTCTTIGNRAFTKCNSLNEVTMGNVTSIGVAAFSYTGLEEFIFPDSVTTIGQSCFYECPNLKKIVIGSSITSIGAQLAQTIGSIMEAVICRATTPPSINAETYKGMNVCPIYVPDASVEAYKTAINWTTYASRIKGMSEYNG